MILYAAQPARFVRQVLGDVVFVLLVAASVWLAMRVHDSVLGLAGPADDVERAGSGLSSGLTDAGEFLTGLPLVGGDVASPFSDASDAADRMASAGADASVAVEQLAFWLGVVVAALPIVLLAHQYLPVRARFVRQWLALRRLGGVPAPGSAEQDLLALRALASQPLSVLAGISPGIAAQWRAGDPEAVRRLAALELRACGVRVPDDRARPPGGPSSRPARSGPPQGPPPGRPPGPPGRPAPGRPTPGPRTSPAGGRRPGAPGGAGAR